ncbi:MAG: UDP-N-acetylglucosamine--N-acetylmuramyl-(pentapeptide) pyrophosphoryl-undecaprenol N-acetylglucosamine transferase [Actinobacteria bacterium]|nr:UDP-N-acetylglucosamine--N-acetylmuramyl-(pentapeptide) pyrophosphoryl-undecaprenol N-acetylglucosamine transferase [Actinomycetota bacterium]MSY82445.1 UDP-N-acetylglucosamine--N-acetylmuramyl-(pentapeptide) pyrophosphoryl-undecaprenol N-acetylglucosamine transferase [Actinomycetota bacterium]
MWRAEIQQLRPRSRAIRKRSEVLKVSNQEALAGARRVVLVGGGTAGHVEPALAVGNWLRTQDSSLAFDFIGTKSGIENELVPAAGFNLRCITKVPLPRRLNISAITFPFRFILSLFQALRIVRGASVIIGFGGYVSASAYVAGKMTGVPIVIHEANALPGWSNRLGARLAARVAVAFPSVPQKFPKWKMASVVGMPIRRNISELAKLSEPALNAKRTEILQSLGFTAELPVVLVFGGSQGSLALNSAIQEFARSIEANKIQFIHAVGMKNSLPVATTNYRPLSYIYEMADMYLAADLIISRSGAVTCAEIEEVHKFAVLVPLAIGNGEQVANAQHLVEDGAALICTSQDFGLDWLKKNLVSTLDSAYRFNATPRKMVSESADQLLGEMALALMKNGLKGER